MTRFYQVTLLLSMLMMLVLIAATRGADAQEALAAPGPQNVQPALTALVMPIGEQRLKSTVTATGSVVAWREMPIGSEASGLTVTAVNVDEGDHVSKGQVLATLDDRVLQAQIAQQQAVIAEAEATLANAQSDVDRANRMTKGVLSQQTVEQRVTAVKTDAAKLAAAKAQLEQYQAELARTQIRSPADAIVAQRSVTLGQVVQSGTELFRLIRDGRLEVDAEVTEADLAKIKPRQDVVVIGPAGGHYQAKVRLVAETVDASTRLGTVHVALPADTPLKVGMFTRVEIDTGEKLALAVPQRALVWREGKAGAFVVKEDDTVAFTPLTIGALSGGMVEVDSGLSRGARIVVDGAGLLNDGDKVNVALASAGAVGGQNH